MQVFSASALYHGFELRQGVEVLPATGDRVGAQEWLARFDALCRAYERPTEGAEELARRL